MTFCMQNHNLKTYKSSCETLVTNKVVWKFMQYSQRIQKKEWAQTHLSCDVIYEHSKSFNVYWIVLYLLEGEEEVCWEKSETYTSISDIGQFGTCSPPKAGLPNGKQFN